MAENVLNDLKYGKNDISYQPWENMRSRMTDIKMNGKGFFWDKFEYNACWKEEESEEHPLDNKTYDYVVTH